LLQKDGAVAQSVEQRTENPCVGGSIPPHTTEIPGKCRGFCIMYTVYILFSLSSGRTYTGYTNDIGRRLLEHNETESTGFTRRYRPWTVIHTEVFAKKDQAMAREKFYKSGIGRQLIKTIVSNYLAEDQVRYPPSAEKD
jgi:putative endonuclease